jgi:hypothetical protein
VKKDLRKIVETRFVYIRIGRGGKDYVALHWFGIGWCQHRVEKTAKESRSMFVLC